MALPELFGDYFQTTLVAPVSNIATTISVFAPASVALQAPGQFRIIVDPDGTPEIMLVTAGASTTTWTVTRGLSGSDFTAPVSHPTGVVVAHVATAGSLGGQSDAAAGVPSLRTLGSGATQALPGTGITKAAVIVTGLAAADIGALAGGSAIVTTAGTVSHPVELLDATSAAFTRTLQTAVGFQGLYSLKAVTTGLNLVTVNTSASQTIDGMNAITLGQPASGALYQWVTLASNQINWVAIN